MNFISYCGWNSYMFCIVCKFFLGWIRMFFIINRTCYYYFFFFLKRNHMILTFINQSFKLQFWYGQSCVFDKFNQFPKYFSKSHPRASLRVNKPSYYQSLQLNHSLRLNNTKIARDNESLNYNFNDSQNIS